MMTLYITRVSSITIRNNDFSVGVGTQHLIDFLVNNKDPRLLYFFQKNDYNSNVVQAYFDQKREMPDFVEKNVISEVKNGKKVFKEWVVQVNLGYVIMVFL